jgi:hypothetical protein
MLSNRPPSSPVSPLGGQERCQAAVLKPFRALPEVWGMRSALLASAHSPSDLPGELTGSWPGALSFPPPSWPYTGNRKAVLQL